MKRTLLLAVAVLSPFVVCAQDARSTLDAAAAAIGAVNLRSIEYSGRGFDFMFGQAYDGNSAWPRFSVPRITVAIDYAAPTIRDDRTRMQVQNPPLGGGFQPIAGELRQIWVLNGSHAWNMIGQNAVPAEPERDLRSAVEGRLGQIWLTPHGFIKAAIAGNANAKTENIRGAKKTIVSFTALNKFKLEGILNEQNLVERIGIWFDNPVLGDMTFEATFSDYKDFGGVKFPTRIVQREGGYPVLDVTVTDVRPNAPVDIDVPRNIMEMKPTPHVIQPEKLAEGIWSLPVDARDHSIAIEFRDHIAVVEAPDSEALSAPAIDVIKKLIPGKPIKYVINTHSHVDHAGGLRTYAAEGATIVTHRDNVPYYEQVWGYPRTINPDRLAKSGRKPTFEGVVGSRIFSDGSRQMIVYHYPGNMHNAGMLMVFLPKERILIEADSYNPPANPNIPPAGIPNLVHFYETVERLRLDVDQVVPIHDRPTALEAVRKAVETYKDSQPWRSQQ